MSEQVKYLLIGAGLAAHHAVRGIRERDPAGRIVMIGSEPELPYTRPHLSKGYLMGKRERAKVYVKPAEFYAELNVEVRTSRTVQALDARKCATLLEDGETVYFERALLATGGEPRRLTIPGAELPGVYYLRTLADADTIKQAMAAAGQAVVIGGGFIGAEVASALTQQGIETKLVFAEDSLLKRQVGPGASKFLTDYFENKGVQLIKNKQVQALIGRQHVAEVKIEDGWFVPAHMVVVGVGVTPRVALAESAGLKVEDGIVVNEYLRTSDPSIYAAGDIARYPDRRYGHSLRLEHWDNAIAMGKAAGLNMAGADQPFEHIPYFYSDLFDLDLQAWGDLYRWNAIIVRRPQHNNPTYFYLHNDQLAGVLSINPSKEEAAALESLVTAMPTVKDMKPFSDPSVPYQQLAG